MKASKEELKARRRIRDAANKETRRAKDKAEYRAKNPDPNPTGRVPYTEKVCPACGVLKQRAEYYKKGTGRSPACKPCTRVKVKKEREDPAVRAKQYKYRKLENLNAYRRNKYATDPRYRADQIAASRRLKAATPAWADKAVIAEVYDNCPDGYEVDHIIPIKAKLASGLHVHENLQYLTKLENNQKKNKYTP